MDTASVYGILAKLGIKGCQSVAKMRVTKELFSPYPVPKRLIEASIKLALENLSAEALRRDLKTQAWEHVSALAWLSLIAEKGGSSEYCDKCSALISEGKIARALALQEFMELHLYKFPLFSTYPLAIEAQIEFAIDEFKYLFKMFKRIFNSYYNEIHFD